MNFGGWDKLDGLCSEQLRIMRDNHWKEGSVIEGNMYIKLGMPLKSRYVDR